VGDKLEEAGAFVFKGGLQGGAESATVVRQSGGDFLLTDGPAGTSTTRSGWADGSRTG
jgi:hypothetical protein